MARISIKHFYENHYKNKNFPLLVKFEATIMENFGKKVVKQFMVMLLGLYCSPLLLSPQCLLEICVAEEGEFEQRAELVKEGDRFGKIGQRLEGFGTLKNRTNGNGVAQWRWRKIFAKRFKTLKKSVLNFILGKIGP